MHFSHVIVFFSLSNEAKRNKRINYFNFFGIDRDTVLEEAMGKSLGLPAHPDPDAFTTRHPVEDVKGVDVKPHPGAFNSFGFYGNTMGKLINWCFLVFKFDLISCL